MSSLPPEPPPPAPSGANPLPWEARETRGLLQSFFDTLGLFFSRPREAWTRTRESGDLASPLLFGVIVCWFSVVVHSLFARFVALPMALPGFLGRRFGMLEAYSGIGFLLHVILAPLFIVIALYIGAAILHVCCMLVGALAQSTSGFEGSFRVVAYSEVSCIASIVPVVGGIIALAWWIVLAIMGVERLHRTTQGKAAAAVLIPVVVCCGGILLAVLLAGAAFLMRGAR